MVRPRNANRVLDNRLWDEHGNEWIRDYRWLARDEVAGLLQQSARAVVHRYHAPIQWLQPGEAKSYWQRLDPHAQYPGDDRELVADDNGLTYAAVEWRRGEERLLGFEEFC